MEVRGVLVHPELLQPAVTHILVQDLNLLMTGHARQVLLQGEGGSELELQTKVRIHFTITDNTLTGRGHPQILSNTKRKQEEEPGVPCCRKSSGKLPSVCQVPRVFDDLDRYNLQLQSW